VPQTILNAGSPALISKLMIMALFEQILLLFPIRKSLSATAVVELYT
jgi:hypothetical protein